MAEQTERADCFLIDKNNRISGKSIRGFLIGLPFDALDALLDDLKSASEDQDCDRARNILLRAVKEYAPENGIDDLVWASRNAAIGARHSDTVVDFPLK